MTISLKNSLLIIFLATILIIPHREAQGKRLGAGFIIGGPTGISTNYIFKKNRSIDGALAFDSNFYLHGTYIYHKPRTFEIQHYRFGWYYGLGIRLKSKYKKDNDDNDKEIYVGPRGSIGISVPLCKRRFELFSEFSVILNIAPKTDVDFDLALGGRVYFNLL